MVPDWTPMSISTSVTAVAIHDAVDHSTYTGITVVLYINDQPLVKSTTLTALAEAHYFM